MAAVDRATAEEALGKIKVEYEELKAVIDVDEAMADGAPLVHEEVGDNLVAHVESKIGDPDKALASAPHVEEIELRTQRGAAGAMECRAILALYDKYPDRFHELFTEEELTEAATSPVRFNLTAYQNPQVLIVERQE